MAKPRGPTYVARVTEHATSRAPEQAAKVLVGAVKQGPREPLTIADAAAASGLPLRDAEAGLHWLVREHRGHLRVGEKGDLLFLFPYGFTKPWETREALDRFFSAALHGLVGVGRFVVRAWITVAMIGYALLFLALVLGLTFARSSDRDERGGIGGAVIGGLFRAIADALFWTFHPFSPFYVDTSSSFDAMPRARRQKKDDVPFYEKVNRFVFGPREAPVDPLATERLVLAQIRAGKGRVGLADVMRATGLPREQVDGMMARLMLDYEGTVEVSEGGGIVYRFPELRRTARDDAPAPAPTPAWTRPTRLLPLTGNGAGTNVLVALLNGFNLVMAGWVLAHGLTIANLIAIFTAKEPLLVLPDPSTPIALGVVPLVFSLGIFLLPIARAALRGREARKVARENGRLAVLREVLERTEKKEPITEPALAKAWRVAAGAQPSSKELTREVVALGGDVDVDASAANETVRYRFADLEAEAEAVEEERAEADDEERRVGKVVFASDA